MLSEMENMFHEFSSDLQDRIKKLSKRLEVIETVMETGADTEAVRASKEQEGSKDRNMGQSRE
jgi:hypothetical protein